MEPVLRAAATYLLLLVVVRITGKRTLAQITTFDFLLLLIIGQAIQYGLVTPDYSITNAFILVITLLGVDLLLSRVGHRVPALARWIDGVPMLLIDDGKVLEERLESSGVTRADILESARLARGIERMEQIKYAVLERSGEISIIPWS